MKELFFISTTLIIENVADMLNYYVFLFLTTHEFDCTSIQSFHQVYTCPQVLHNFNLCVAEIDAKKKEFIIISYIYSKLGKEPNLLKENKILKDHLPSLYLNISFNSISIKQLSIYL